MNKGRSTTIYPNKERTETHCDKKYVNGIVVKEISSKRKTVVMMMMAQHSNSTSNLMKATIAKYDDDNVLY